MKANELRIEMGHRAEKLFHEWAKLPDYEKMDEDMALALVGSIRDHLITAYLDGWYEPKPGLKNGEKLHPRGSDHD